MTPRVTVPLHAKETIILTQKASQSILVISQVGSAEAIRFSESAMRAMDNGNYLLAAALSLAALNNLLARDNQQIRIAAHVLSQLDDIAGIDPMDDPRAIQLIEGSLA